MHNQNLGRKVLFLVLLFAVIIAIIVAVIGTFKKEPPQNAESTNSPETSTSTSRQVVYQRRKILMDVMSALESYALTNNNRFPSGAEVQDVLSGRMGPLPLDPATKEAFSIQLEAPGALNEIQYAPYSICTENLYSLKRTSSPGEAALLIKDSLNEYFCLSNKVNSER